MGCLCTLVNVQNSLSIPASEVFPKACMQFLSLSEFLAIGRRELSNILHIIINFVDFMALHYMICITYL
jgi:hypothetical protein